MFNIRDSFINRIIPFGAHTEATEEDMSLLSSLVGQTYVKRDEYSGISLKLDADGRFEISHWKSEKRDSNYLNIFKAEFYGQIDSVSKLDGSTILEVNISKIDKASAMIFDVYYPPNEDVDIFVGYFPWDLGMPVRIVPPLEPDAICLIGTSNTDGEYVYSEFIPFR